MIRINLLGIDRQRARKAPVFDAAQRVAAACSLILVATIALLGWWYWTLEQESARVDMEIAAAQQETQRLQSLLTEVTQFEQQRAQLQQRVALIEQLRRGQSVPVQLLDHVSRSLPDMLWLVALEQEDNEVTIEGQSTTLIALSDFVGNLGNGTLLRRPIEIVNSQVETAAGPAAPAAEPLELIRFTVRATLAQTPGAAPAMAPGASAAAEVPR